MNMNVLSDNQMRKAGFTDFVKTTWYYSTMLGEEVSFNVTIEKNNSLQFAIDILDDDFCQPYDYQYILGRNPTHEFALSIKAKVEKEMLYLMKQGIISNYKIGDYI